MKRTLSRLLVFALCIAVLTGCGCEHQWNDATCTAPKTCALCQEAEGEPLGHTWTDANCENPKTCTACNTTEGNALGHTWVDATCEVPKTCSVCAKTEGEPLEHTLGDWADIDAEIEQRACTACSYTEEQTIDRKARLLAFLEGDWITTGMFMDNALYTYEELESVNIDTSELTMYFYFDADGKGHLTTPDEKVELAVSSDYEVAYTAQDEADQYTFYIYDEGGVSPLILLITEEEEAPLYQLLFAAGNIAYIFSPVA